MANLFRQIFFVVCMAQIGVANNVYSQTMYRCGKTFQDRPCDSGQTGQAIGRATSAADPAIAGGSSAGQPMRAGGEIAAAQCAQRGIDAQKIKWEREAGMTKEAQLSLPKSSDERRLIADVYMRQGSAPQIRAAVESDCLKDAERRAQAAALMMEAGKLLVDQNPSPPPATRVTADVPSTATAQPQVDLKEESRKGQCADLQRSADGVRQRQRTGGSGASMEALNRERQGIDQRLRDAGC
jgi:hypothetical protein